MTDEEVDELVEQFVNGESVFNVLRAAEQRGVEDERERLARMLEAIRFRRPGREAEWTRHLAMMIRQGS